MLEDQDQDQDRSLEELQDWLLVEFSGNDHCSRRR